MFSAIFTAIGAIASLLMFLLLAGMLLTHPWMIPVLVIFFVLVTRWCWRKFKRMTTGAPLNTAKLYPPGYEPFKGTIAEREHPADRRTERIEHQFVEPITMGGHSRNHHG
jgi:hypothetical protein